MSTSGFYQSTASFLIDNECCDYTGWVDVTEDFEDFTVWWECPNCGEPNTGEMTRDDDH